MESTYPVAFTPEHCWLPFLHLTWDQLHPALLVNLPHGDVLLQQQLVPLLHGHVQGVQWRVVLHIFNEFEKLCIIVGCIAWVWEVVLHLYVQPRMKYRYMKSLA